VQCTSYISRNIRSTASHFPRIPTQAPNKRPQNVKQTLQTNTCNLTFPQTTDEPLRAECNLPRRMRVLRISIHPITADLLSQVVRGSDMDIGTASRNPIFVFDSWSLIEALITVDRFKRRFQYTLLPVAYVSLSR
jgi:hypothetical protein